MSVENIMTQQDNRDLFEIIKIYYEGEITILELEIEIENIKKKYEDQRKKVEKEINFIIEELGLFDDKKKYKKNKNV